MAETLESQNWEERCPQPTPIPSEASAFVLDEDARPLVAWLLSVDGQNILPTRTAWPSRVSFGAGKLTTLAGSQIRVEIEGQDLLARIFRHELDHLNGTKRDILLRKLKKTFLTK